MTFSPEEKVKWFAITSRLTLLLLQFVSNLLLPDHDAGVFAKPRSHPDTSLDRALLTSLGGLSSWDAQYFLHIAEYGYTYENILAFFPLFPLSLRPLSTLIPLLSPNTALLLAAVCLNNALFIKTSSLLYKLSSLVLKNEKLAYISAILFCVNPASIFFSSVYSESLFCYLTFHALLLIETRTSFLNNILVGLSCLTRSNGTLNIGFIIYSYIKLRARNNLSFLFNIICCFGLLLTILPFLAYQIYCYGKFCFSNHAALPDFIKSYGTANGFVFPGEGGVWCNSTFPLAYSYVQNHYWDVGFLKYYQLKQIPNFLLASPVLFIIFHGCLGFARQHKTYLLYLGLVKSNTTGDLPITLFPYIAHAFVLAVFCTFMIHIQVSTRLIASSSPVLYWFCALPFTKQLQQADVQILKKSGMNRKDYQENQINRKSKWRCFILTKRFKGFAFYIQLYFLSYFVIGTVLFSNHLPWT